MASCHVTEYYEKIVFYSDAHISFYAFTTQNISSFVTACKLSCVNYTTNKILQLIKFYFHKRY